MAETAKKGGNVKKGWIKWIRRTERDGRSRWAKRDEKKRKNRRIAETEISKEGWTVGCPRKTLFKKNKKRNPPRISLRVSLNRSKRIFDFDQV